MLPRCVNSVPPSALVEPDTVCVCVAQVRARPLCADDHRCSSRGRDLHAELRAYHAELRAYLAGHS